VGSVGPLALGRAASAKQAAAQITTALELREPYYVRSRVLDLAGLARVRLIQGEPEEAMSTAGRAPAGFAAYSFLWPAVGLTAAPPSEGPVPINTVVIATSTHDVLVTRRIRVRAEAILGPRCPLEVQAIAVTAPAPARLAVVTGHRIDPEEVLPAPDQCVGANVGIACSETRAITVRRVQGGKQPRALAAPGPVPLIARCAGSSTTVVEELVIVTGAIGMQADAVAEGGAEFEAVIRVPHSIALIAERPVRLGGCSSAS